MKKIRTKFGFTLVEMAMTISVLGILLAANISLYNNLKLTQDYNITTERMVVIQAALMNYYNSNGKLPCPASIDLSLKNTNFGVELDCSSSITPAGLINANLQGGSPAADVRIGAIPVRALGISNNYAIDEWNNIIKYAVIRNITTSTSALLTYNEAYEDVIKIVDINGNRVNRSNNFVAGKQSYVGYVLVSNGSNQNGATNSVASSKSCDGSKTDAENCDNDAIFITTNNSLSQKTDFDDIVAWDTIGNFKFNGTYFGGGLAPKIAIFAEQITSQPNVFPTCGLPAESSYLRELTPLQQSATTENPVLNLTSKITYGGTPGYINLQAGKYVIKAYAPMDSEYSNLVLLFNGTPVAWGIPQTKCFGGDGLNCYTAVPDPFGGGFGSVTFSGNSYDEMNKSYLNAVITAPVDGVLSLRQVCLEGQSSGPTSQFSGHYTNIPSYSGAVQLFSVMEIWELE